MNQRSSSLEVILSSWSLPWLDQSSWFALLRVARMVRYELVSKEFRLICRVHSSSIQPNQCHSSWSLHYLRINHGWLHLVDLPAENCVACSWTNCCNCCWWVPSLWRWSDCSEMRRPQYLKKCEVEFKLSEEWTCEEWFEAVAANRFFIAQNVWLTRPSRGFPRKLFCLSYLRLSEWFLCCDRFEVRNNICFPF